MIRLKKPTLRQAEYGILGICACCLAASLPVTGSIALMQSKDSAANKFSVDSNESEIVEEFTKPSSLTRGTVIHKKVSVKNTGDITCYVRVRILPSSDPDAFQFDYNTTDWVHDGNDVSDWWYYKKPIAKNESTTNLITKATLLRDLDMTYINLDSGNAQIIVYEETAQAYGASTPQQAFQ